MITESLKMTLYLEAVAVDHHELKASKFQAIQGFIARLAKREKENNKLAR